MLRTTVYLSRDSKRRLAQTARRRHRSEAELIRDAIDLLLASEPERPKPNPPTFAFDPEIVNRVDEYLAAGFGSDGIAEDVWPA
ncbi:MAG TPA: CopG family transcriptional regulator [Pseudonocardiaceae bacterium]|nr:CopG family transcriptional regulator [Pseudonocardiaceae bacterium]